MATKIDKFALDANWFRKASPLTSLDGHSKKVHTVAWNSDGKRLASGSADRNVIVWHFGSKSTGTKDQELKGHSDPVDQLTWDPTHSELLASTSADKSVRVWDARSGKCAANVPTKGENLNICWSPDGNTIAVGNKEDQITFIDRRKYSVMGSPVGFKMEVNEIGWNNSNNLFFMTTGNGTVEVYPWNGKLEPDKKLVTLEAHTMNCLCIKFDPRDKYFAVGSADALVSIWDLATFTCVQTVSALEWPARTLGFSADGQFIASGSEDDFIDISEVETGNQVHRIESDAATNALAWHPRLPILAFGCDRPKADKGGGGGGGGRDGGGGGDSEGCVKLFGLGMDVPSGSSRKD